jgi:ATP-dependent Clp protease ATP-binding subunit ClpB
VSCQAKYNTGFNPLSEPYFGARPVKRVIQKEILDAVSTEIIADKVDKAKPIKVDYQDNAFTFAN